MLDHVNVIHTTPLNIFLNGKWPSFVSILIVLRYSLPSDSVHLYSYLFLYTCCHHLCPNRYSFTKQTPSFLTPKHFLILPLFTPFHPILCLSKSNLQNPPKTPLPLWKRSLFLARSNHNPLYVLLPLTSFHHKLEISEWLFHFLC